MSSDDEEFSEDSLRKILIKKCIEAKEFAYCPYSKFRVGAALLTDDNKIYTGCNVENASYGLSICAERTAIVKAVSEGHKKFKEIACTTDITTDYVGPCGACRSFIAEFGLDISVILIKSINEYQVFTISALLPLAFDGSFLKQHAKEILNEDEYQQQQQPSSIQHHHHHHHNL